MRAPAEACTHLQRHARTCLLAVNASALSKPGSREREGGTEMRGPAGAHCALVAPWDLQELLNGGSPGSGPPAAAAGTQPGGSGGMGSDGGGEAVSWQGLVVSAAGEVPGWELPVSRQGGC